MKGMVAFYKLQDRCQFQCDVKMFCKNQNFLRTERAVVTFCDTDTEFPQSLQFKLYLFLSVDRHGCKLFFFLCFYMWLKNILWSLSCHVYFPFHCSSFASLNWRNHLCAEQLFPLRSCCLLFICTIDSFYTTNDRAWLEHYLLNMRSIILISCNGF